MECANLIRSRNVASWFARDGADATGGTAGNGMAEGGFWEEAVIITLVYPSGRLFLQNTAELREEFIEGAGEGRRGGVTKSATAGASSMPWRRRWESRESGKGDAIKRRIAGEPIIGE